jgi:hypothetical protein
MEKQVEYYVKQGGRAFYMCKPDRSNLAIIRKFGSKYVAQELPPS